MSCIYKYKGRTFNSEIELDDFLIEKLGYESKYGDIIFNKKSNFLRSKNVIENRIKRDAEEALLKMKIRNARIKAAYLNGEEVLNFPRPYVGVNKFLSEVRHEGNRLLPEFIEENYWENRKEKWTSPLEPTESIRDRFTDDEIDIFFEADPNKTYTNPREEFEDKIKNLRLLNEDECKLLEELMTKKWKFLAAAGTAVHYILEQYFTKEKDLLVGDQSREDLIARIKSNINSDLSEQMGDSRFRSFDGHLFNDSIIEQVLDYADGLKAQLRRKYGKECEFYPELEISLKMTGNPGETDTVLGIIDLLVVDKFGLVHYFDYKTSPKPFDKFDSAKKRAYLFLLAMYGKLLKKYNLNYRNSDISILPIQFLELKLINPEEAHINPKKALFSYTGITYKSDYTENETRSKIFEVGPTGSEKILDILDDYLPEEIVLDVTSENLLQNIEETEKQWFPDYNKYKAKSYDEVKSMLEDEGSLKPVDRNGKLVYIYQAKGVYSKEIIADSDIELIEKVQKYLDKIEKRSEKFANITRRALKYGIENVTPDIGDYVASIDSKSLPDSTSHGKWFVETLGQYCNGNWELVEIKPLESLGIIALKNIKTNQIDIIKLSNSNLQYNPFETKSTNGKRIKLKNHLISYAHLPDIVETSNQKSLMLNGYKGNIEMLEILLALNNVNGLDDAVIGNIQVINPYQATGMTASNEELLYTFKKMSILSPLSGDNNILNGKIKLGSAFDLGVNAFNEAMETSSYYLIDPSNYNSAQSALEEGIEHKDKEQKIEAIDKIINNLEKAHPDLLKDGVTREGLLVKPYVRLYNSLLLARRSLDGINFKLQINDHDKWSEERTLKGLFFRGLSGTYTDNPGNMLSDTLNTVAKLVSQAYLNIRNKMGTRVAQIRSATEELKKHKGYTGVSQAFGNATNMYANMTEVVGGDLLFKDLSSGDLDDVERKYLKLILEIINENRFGGKKSKKELELMRDSHNLEYYRVPLCMATAESQDSIIGLENGLKERLKRFNPKTALNEIKANVDGIFLEEDPKHYQLAEELFKVNNRFNKSEQSVQYRLDAIKKNGAGFFERNLEVLAFKHCYAYESAKALNKVFPIMKSAMAYLSYAGNSVNKEFENDGEYFENYIKNSVKGLPIQDNEKMLEATAVAGKIKQIASFMALAFSPVQGAYLTIQGLWQDISLIIRKPDGTHAFSAKNMFFAAKQVYLDLFHYSDKPTKCLLINEWLGINDMDMNIYAERMRTDLHNKYNFVNFAFKFASRPDFYNRMTIVIAKMKEDGIWDALEVLDGKLVYNFKKDKRFSAFANGEISNPNYNNLRALYHTIAQQFITEGVTNPDGSAFLISRDSLHPTPLPYAWTNQEAESIKSLCDLIYGYYSHEKKSLIHATFLGSLYMLMKTYWSGKKNLYLAPGGVRIQGKWDQATNESGELLYYQVKEDGTIDFDAQLTTTPTNAPFYLWKGLFQEGIIVTLSTIFKNGVLSKEGLKQGWDEVFNNEDRNISTIRRANMKLLLLDILFYMGIGMLLAGYLMSSWDKELTKNAKESKQLSDALKATLVHVARVSMGLSAEDFAWWSSIGNPAVNWSPFSITQATNIGKRVWNSIFGDSSFYNGVTKSFAAGKQMGPLIDWLNPENM